jgi:hypothetical protein
MQGPRHAWPVALLPHNAAKANTALNDTLPYGVSGGGGRWFQRQGPFANSPAADTAHGNSPCLPGGTWWWFVM